MFPVQCGEDSVPAFVLDKLVEFVQDSCFELWPRLVITLESPPQRLVVLQTAAVPIYRSCRLPEPADQFTLLRSLILPVLRPRLPACLPRQPRPPRRPQPRLHCLRNLELEL